MTKVPGDGQPFVTREEQEAAKSDEQKQADADVKEGGLAQVADRRDPGWRDR